MKRDNDALKSIVSRFETSWQQETKQAIDRLYQLLDKGLKVDTALTKLRKEFPKLFELVGLKDSLIEAAAYGYGIMPTILTEGDKKSLTKTLETPWCADGIKLSRRLHTGGDRMINEIRQVVQNQVRHNASAVEIAHKLYEGLDSKNNITQSHNIARYMQQIETLQGQTRNSSSLLRQAERNINRLARNGAPTKALKDAYKKLLHAVESGNDQAIQDAIKSAIEEKSRYIADRIARTEMARAYSDGFFSKNQDDDDVIGYQFKLSTRHPVFDICDMYAKADMFGLGAGVFPKDKVPQVPVHPHCLCKYKVLYKGQIDPTKQVNRQKEAMVEWLDGIGQERAIQVLGLRGYDEYMSAKTAYNKSKSKTHYNILNNVIMSNLRGYTPLESPDYRNLYMGLKASSYTGVKDHYPPKLLKTIDINDKEVIKQEINTFEERYYDSKTEHALVITTKGEVYKCYGTADGVYPDIDLGNRLIGAIVSHNHPIEYSELSFSNEDFNLFRKYNLQILRGIDIKYIYEYTRVNTKVDKPADIFSASMDDPVFRHNIAIETATNFKVGYHREKR